MPRAAAHESRSPPPAKISCRCRLLNYSTKRGSAHGPAAAVCVCVCVKAVPDLESSPFSPATGSRAAAIVYILAIFSHSRNIRAFRASVYGFLFGAAAAAAASFFFGDRALHYSGRAKYGPGLLRTLSGTLK